MFGCIGLAAILVVSVGPRLLSNQLFLFVPLLMIMTFPGTVFFYYAILLIPPLSVVLLCPTQQGTKYQRLMGDTSPLVTGTWVLLITTVATTFYPIPIIGQELGWISDQSSLSGPVNVVQAIAGPLNMFLLLAILITLCSDERRRRLAAKKL